jgi:hypothetical protein
MNELEMNEEVETTEKDRTAAIQQQTRSRGLQSDEQAAIDLLTETGHADHACIEIHNAARLSPRQRNVISEWLRTEARRLESGGDSYPADYTANLNQLNA